MADWPSADPDIEPPPPRSISCWRLPIAAVDDACERRLGALLDTAECARAARFRLPGDRRRFTVAHAGLRVLLSAALRCRPLEVHIVQAGLHKPIVPGGAIEFNLTHSGAIVAIALARIPVGVDVELIRDMPDRAAIVERFFHPAESAALASSAPEAAQTAFFRTWTRKEAVAKAVGLGLSLPLDEYCVSTNPADPCVVALPDGQPPADQWSLFDIAPEPGYIGAIAVAQRGVNLVCRTLDLTVSSPTRAA